MENLFETLKTMPFDIMDFNPSLRKHGIGFPHTEETKKHLSEMKKGIKQTPEHIQKRVSKTIGFKQSNHQKEIAAKTFSKEWLITNPLGQIYKIKNLRSFCRENGLDQGNMSRNRVRGWNCVKLET